MSSKAKLLLLRVVHGLLGMLSAPCSAFTASPSDEAAAAPCCMYAGPGVAPLGIGNCRRMQPALSYRIKFYTRMGVL